MTSLADTKIDDFLDLVDVHVDAFAICEIGRNHALKVDPVDHVLIHFALKGEGFLDCDSVRSRLCRGTVVLVPKCQAKLLCGAGPVEHQTDMSSTCRLEDGLIKFLATDGTADLILGCAKVTVSSPNKLTLFDRIEQPLIIDTGKSLTSIFDTLLDELRK